MKKTWADPRIEVQQFVPNEYVAACIVGSIQCAYPGDGKTNGLMIYDDYKASYGSEGWYYDSYELWHGICGEETGITFNGTTASGYESINGVTQHNRVISNVSGYTNSDGSVSTGTYYDVTWTSQITGDDTVYHHVGRLTITYIDEEHPNRS